MSTATQPGTGGLIPTSVWHQGRGQSSASALVLPGYLFPASPMRNPGRHFLLQPRKPCVSGHLAEHQDEAMVGVDLSCPLRSWPFPWPSPLTAAHEWTRGSWGTGFRPSPWTEAAVFLGEVGRQSSQLERSGTEGRTPRKAGILPWWPSLWKEACRADSLPLYLLGDIPHENKARSELKT